MHLDSAGIWVTVQSGVQELLHDPGIVPIVNGLMNLRPHVRDVGRDGTRPRAPTVRPPRTGPGTCPLRLGRVTGDEPPGSLLPHDPVDTRSFDISPLEASRVSGSVRYSRRRPWNRDGGGRGGSGVWRRRSRGPRRSPGPSVAGVAQAVAFHGGVPAHSKGRSKRFGVCLA